MKRIILCCVLCLSLRPVFASLENDLERFFKSAGFDSTLNSPGAYQDQSAGYYTGGSLMARSSVRTLQPASIQMPGFRAGCGGIDAWMGGLSHIKGEGLSQFFRQVGSKVPSYALLLMLQTVSPTIYNLLNELNALATQVNQFNTNSCELAATMLGGLWPKSDQASKHLCQDMGSNLGVFSDWSEARHGCGAKGDREGILNRRGSDPRYQHMLTNEFNLTWTALQLNDFLKADQALAELFMTLSGTLIVRKAGDRYELIHQMSPADQDSLLKSLLEGGEVALYRCPDTACLNPQKQSILLPKHAGLLHKVQTILEKLVFKMTTDEAISKEEKAFLNSVQLPIYKILTVSTAYRLGSLPLNLQEYAGLIALDILYQYLFELFDVVQISLLQLKRVQVDSKPIDEFLKNLQTVRGRLTTRRSHAFQQMDAILSLIESVKLIEKQLHVMLGTVANETYWY